jgi:hypothetical protein
MTKAMKEKILNHLEEEKNFDNPDKKIKELSERYDVPTEIVESVIAEWSAGRRKALNKDVEDES